MMRASIVRLLSILVVVCTCVTALGAERSSAAQPIVYAVGTFPGGGPGYLFCYPAGVGGANPANPFGGFAGAATTLTTPEGVTASAATNFFYVTDFGVNAVDEWRLPCPAAIANAAPARRIIGGATTLNRPLGIAIDIRRRLLYVANSGNNTVSIFRSNAAGNVPPLCVLGGAATLLNNPAHIVVEPAIAGARHPGWLYVANFGGASITAYRPMPCGNVPPALMIHGALTGLGTPFGVDTYISQFPGHAGVSAIYVGDPQVGKVLVYKDGLPVNQAPFQVLGGPVSTLVCPSDVRVSSQTFLIYAEDPCANNGGNPAGRIDAFVPNAVFNVAPALWYVAPPGIISNPLGLWLLDRN